MEIASESWWFARTALTHGVAAIYLLGFVAVVHQFTALLGERGLLPVPEYLRYVSFREAPSLFHWRYSDRLARGVGWCGIVLSALVMAGLLDRAPLPLWIGVWLVMWALYMSVVNVGQIFYGFGWESMLLEAGFFCAFLGPASVDPPWVAIFALRCMLFRVELGAGLIKIRHDECWRNLTCLDYHHETQPMPNPLSRAFHRLPRAFHRMSVIGSHVIQIGLPFLLFAPQPVAALAAAGLVLQQLVLIVSGNYAWLNWLTVILGFSAVSDGVLGLAPWTVGPGPAWFSIILFGFAAVVAGLQIAPLANLFSRNQYMNYSWNPLHLVNSYGAFGSVTKERYEIVLEATDEDSVRADTVWREYDFIGKPGDPTRRPPQIAPYHLRLDWLMWFLPFSVRITRSGPLVGGYEPWFIAFVSKLLDADADTLRLLRGAPYGTRPPSAVRALYYRYSFADGPRVWKRTLIGEYLPAVGLRDKTRSQPQPASPQPSARAERRPTDDRVES